ncbi:putative c6 transcription factor [Phaeomoniella chlamydospora]|uniref:Putative c6 transcription factor n=1 Tax=Phaeomoniella chlamydospora TaxID=158046 RepID=A0A0G2GNE0_PHACM|nr:putative c6 transcription factor [Phaeomoniella chlamydospora]
MMAFVHFTSGNFQTVDILLGLAARYVFMLGAHLYPALDLDHASSDSTSIINRTIIHRRNLFWLCYILDKELSFRTGFPPSINDTSCDLRPPTNYLDADTQSMPQYFPGDLRLSRIKSRAYNNLYSPQAMKRTDAEILKEIRELDDELEKWRISLPSVSRPSLTYSTESSKFSPFSSEDKIHVCLLRLEYYHCTAAIHQASNRCKTWFDKDSGVMEGVGSSLAISVEASRSTIRCLEASQDLLHDHIFWVLLFYPITAVLTLFFNVLHEPLHPMVALDLKLLKSAVCCLRQACSRTRGLAVNEVLHIKFVDDFVTELVRLARCAMDKAKQQQRETSGT